MESPESKWGFIVTWALLASTQLEGDWYSFILVSFLLVVGTLVYLAYSSPGRKWFSTHMERSAQRWRARKLVKFTHSCNQKADRIHQEIEHYETAKRSANADRKQLILSRQQLNKRIVTYNLYVQAHDYLWKGEDKVHIITYIPRVD